MKLATPTLSQVRAKLAAIRRASPKHRRYGVRCGGPCPGPAELEVEGHPVRLAWCPSVLEFREALLEGGPDDRLLALFTDRPDSELGADVLARLAGGRLYTINRWELVCDLFRAQTLDPRLVKLDWMADRLIEGAPCDGYPAVSGGILDADTAWKTVLRHCLGFPDGRPDARAILKWTAEPEGLRAYRQAPRQMKADLGGWLESTAGHLARVLLGAVDANADIKSGASCLALGLALRVLTQEDAGGPQLPLRESAVRLERYLGGLLPAPEEARLWCSLAEELVRGRMLPGNVREVAGVLEELDAVLTDVRALDFAMASDFSYAGFEQRLATFAAAIEQFLEAAPGAAPPDGAGLCQRVDEAARDLLAHLLLRAEPARERAVRMAWRACRFLARCGAEPGGGESLVELARDYSTEGCFVDWARTTLRDGDASATLTKSLRRLGRRLLELRESQNERFGRLLAQVCVTGVAPPGMLLVEEVLDEVLAGLAAKAPVLFVVLDGVGHPILRELRADLDMRGWWELLPVGRTAPLLVLSGLPSMTGVSRTSLLCGRLTSGEQGAEKAGFQQHDKLKAASGSHEPPVLFHKGELTATAGGLSDAVVEEIARESRRVVGAVINAVDDHLSRGDQLSVQWRADAVPLLEHLLAAARKAGRIVVLTSDHGHVLERDCEAAPDATGGDRWRVDDGKPRAGEVVLAGPRIMGGKIRSVIVPWTERLRYGQQHHGYHGGATPQEVLVPLVVLASHSPFPEGWDCAPPVEPEWWSPESGLMPARPERPLPALAVAESASVPMAARPAGPKAPARRPAAPAQPTLFEAASALSQPPAEPSGLAGVEWFERLLASPVYREQRARVRRLQLDDERIRRLLGLLEEHGGKMTCAAVARRLEMPEYRLSGMLAGMRRLLNVDGCSVLEVDESSDTVVFDRKLLETQFGIGPDAL